MAGAFLTARTAFVDSRGSFTKILGEDDSVDGDFVTREVFWSRSTRGVVRGLHVQLPPRATRKLVFVTHGAIIDFALDLRVGSPSQGRVLSTPLDETTGGLVIPAGCALGFEVVSDEASMVYCQEDYYSAEHDGGVLLTSVDIGLQSREPVLSDRDLALPAFTHFVSPFEFA
jgi:dTDP-4-dehydrorhamnose 3,5-epimerase